MCRTSVTTNLQNWKTEVVAIVSHYLMFLSSSGMLLRKLVGVMHEQLVCKCLAVQMSDADLTKCLEMQHNQLTFWNAWFFNTFDTGISMDAEVGWGKLGFFERCLLCFGSYSKIVIFIWLDRANYFVVILNACRLQCVMYEAHWCFFKCILYSS